MHIGINNLDALRLLLAFLVFLAHWNGLASVDSDIFIFHLSGLAVDMFFVVSGFLIFWSFDTDNNLKRFYIKRFFRIFPLYAILIVLQSIFFITFSDGSASEVIKYIGFNLLFLNFLAPSVGSVFSEFQVDAINGSLWTLKNEVAFYILVPFIYAAYKRFGSVVLAFLYVFSVIYMLIVDYLGFDRLLVQFPAQLRLFIIGIGIYIFFKRISPMLVVSLVVLGLSYFLLIPGNHFFRFSVYPIFVGAMVLSFAYLFPLVKINFDFSYSLYILHFPLIQLSLYFGLSPDNYFSSFMALTILLLFLSFYSEKYIEKPFVNYGRKLAKKI